MRLYHGTASTYLPAIESSGLAYTPSSAAKLASLTSYQWGDQEREDAKFQIQGLYLTADKATAEKFARLKANYLKARPGSLVWENPSYHGSQIGGWKTKDAQPPVAGAKPVVLELEIPDTFPLHDDEASGSATRAAYWTTSTIPASAIVKIDKVPALKNL